MPVIETSRKGLSEVVKGLGLFTNSAGTNYSYAVVDVKGAAAVDPIGTMLVWDGTSAFEPYLAQDISAATASVFPSRSTRWYLRPATATKSCCSATKSTNQTIRN